MQITLNFNKRKYIYNFMIVLVMWGWLILSNFIELFDIKINLYTYIVIVSPIYMYLFITGNYKKVCKNGIGFILITILTLGYFIFLGMIKNNILSHTKYYFNMFHICFIVLPLLVINFEKFNIRYYSKILYGMIGIFSWLAFINIASRNFIINSRFLNANVTGFLVSQYIILSVYYNKRSIFNKITIGASIIVLLACGTRSAMMALIFTIIAMMLKSGNAINVIKKIIFIIPAYICGYLLYYKLIIIPELTFYLRPLGVIFLDENNIFNKASIGRINYFEEYINIIFNTTSNFIFGVGPNSFTNYSHNIFMDLLGFGGIITLIIYLMIFAYITFKCEKSILFYQFYFFSISFLFTSSIFINSIYFSIILIMICMYNSNLNKRRVYEL